MGTIKTTASVADIDKIAGLKSNASEIDSAVVAMPELGSRVSSFEGTSKQLNIITPGSARLAYHVPDYNEETGKITFYTDTIFIVQGEEKYIIGSTIEVDIHAYTTSSALMLVFNTDTKEISAQIYAHVTVENEIIFGAIRTQGASNRISSIDMPCLFRVNGLVYPYELETVKKNLFPKSKVMPNSTVEYIMHRGLSQYAPENSLASYRDAARLDYKFAECDVSLTSDGVPVIMHDLTLNRTCTLTDGSEIGDDVRLDSVTFATLRSDYRLRSTEPQYRTQVPSYTEHLINCRQYGINPMLEIKNTYTQDQVNAVVDEALQYFTPEQVVFLSFYAQYLDWARDHNPDITLYYIDYGSVDNMVAKAPAAIFPDANDLTEDIVKECISKGVTVACWDVSVDSSSDLIRMGVQQIVADATAPQGTNPYQVYHSDGTFDGCTTNGTITNGQMILSENQTFSKVFNVPENYLGAFTLIIEAKGEYIINCTGVHQKQIANTGKLELYRFGVLLHGARTTYVSITATSDMVVSNLMASIDLN